MNTLFPLVGISLSVAMVFAPACVLILRGFNFSMPYIGPSVSQTGIPACCHK